MQTTDTKLVQPSINLENCIDADTCSRELNRCADEADKCAAMAQGCAEIAIRHAWNAGAVCLKAKEILSRGEFGPWLEENSKERGIVTLYKWMKLAKFQLNEILSGQPKGLNDAYIAAGVLPMAEQKQQQEGEEQEKPAFVLSFKTKYKNVTEWDKDSARDFLYEFERLGRLAMQLKTEFGI